MTPDAYVFSALSTSGLKGTKNEWRLGHVPPLPWFVVRRARAGQFHADNDVFIQMIRFRAELWMRENDPNVREKFEEAVRKVGPFTTNEAWVATENAYQVEYTFTYHPGTGE